MEYVISGWCQCPAFPGDRSSHHCMCGGVFASSAPWRVSDLSVWSGAWWGTSSPGWGPCRQTDVPIWPGTSWPGLILPWATPLGPGGSGPPGSSLSWGHGWSLLGLLLGGPLAVPCWLEWPYQQLLWHWLWWVSTEVPQADWHLGGAWVNSQYVVVRTTEAGSWGPNAGLASTWTCMQCAQMSVLPHMLMAPVGEWWLSMWCRHAPGHHPERIP